MIRILVVGFQRSKFVITHSSGRMDKNVMSRWLFDMLVMSSSDGTFSSLRVVKHCLPKICLTSLEPERSHVFIYNLLLCFADLFVGLEADQSSG